MQRYDDRGENFYFTQEDFLFSLAAKRTWDWNVIRPNAIVGFTPAGMVPCVREGKFESNP
jgi:hypothetical protein